MSIFEDKPQPLAMEDMHLWQVTVRRTYTDDYMERYGGKREWDSVCLSWSFDAESLAERWAEHQKPGRYPSFDKMYRDSVVNIERVSDEALAERRAKIANNRFYPNPCCELAVLDNCVCSWKSTCPVHGSICHGSHD